MSINLPSEVYTFLWSIIAGFVIGIIFDIFRISRKFIKTNDIITYIEDIMFWIIVGIIMLLTAFYFNNGQIRGFVFLGMFLGSIMYFLTISNLFIRITTKIISFLIKIVMYISKIIYKPIVSILKIIYYPLKYLIAYIKKCFKQFTKIIKSNFVKWFDFKRVIKIINKKV